MGELYSIETKYILIWSWFSLPQQTDLIMKLYLLFIKLLFQIFKLVCEAQFKQRFYIGGHFSIW